VTGGRSKPIDAGGCEANQHGITEREPADRVHMALHAAACKTDRMRALPPETLHLPFETGPYRMALGLIALPEAAWFELDDRYLPELQERRRLLHERHAEVFAALPVSDAARAEALADIADNLTTHHPDWFGRDGNLLRNRLTDEHGTSRHRRAIRWNSRAGWCRRTCALCNLTTQCRS